jgi:hypothetical protein
MRYSLWKLIGTAECRALLQIDKTSFQVCLILWESFQQLLEK